MSASDAAIGRNKPRKVPGKVHVSPVPSSTVPDHGRLLDHAGRMPEHGQGRARKAHLARHHGQDAARRRARPKPKAPSLLNDAHTDQTCHALGTSEIPSSVQTGMSADTHSSVQCVATQPGSSREGASEEGGDLDMEQTTGQEPTQDAAGRGAQGTRKALAQARAMYATSKTAPPFSKRVPAAGLSVQQVCFGTVLETHKKRRAKE
jgi:hypothetical protein